jgi:hypothetical protein
MNGPVEIEKYNYSEFVGSDFLPCRAPEVWSRSKSMHVRTGLRG